MLPLHHNLRTFGGSWAQRQILNCTMIEAAVRAGNTPVAMGLVAELSSRKPNNGRLKALLGQLQAEAASAPSNNGTKEPPMKKTRL
jgi:hypothetical protein